MVGRGYRTYLFFRNVSHLQGCLPSKSSEVRTHHESFVEVGSQEILLLSISKSARCHASVSASEWRQVAPYIDEFLLLPVLRTAGLVFEDHVIVPTKSPHQSDLRTAVWSSGTLPALDVKVHRVQERITTSNVVFSLLLLLGRLFLLL